MCRILYAASQLVGWQTLSVRPLAGLGAAFFFPPLGPFTLMSEYPPVRIIQGLYLGRDVALVSLLVGYRTPLAGWVVGITQIALAGFRYSAGKIDHELLVFALPIILSFSCRSMPPAAGRGLSGRAPQDRPWRGSPCSSASHSSRPDS
jgi:hypothetical protein